MRINIYRIITLFAFTVLISGTSNAQSLHDFCVVAGSFKQEANAKKQEALIIKDGYKDCTIRYEKSIKSHRVIVESFDEKKKAYEAAVEMRNSNKTLYSNAWILTLSTGDFQPLDAVKDEVTAQESDVSISKDDISALKQEIKRLTFEVNALKTNKNDHISSATFNSYKSSQGSRTQKLEEDLEALKGSSTDNRETSFSLAGGATIKFEMEGDKKTRIGEYIAGHFNINNSFSPLIEVQHIALDSSVQNIRIYAGGLYSPFNFESNTSLGFAAKVGINTYFNADNINKSFGNTASGYVYDLGLYFRTGTKLQFDIQAGYSIESIIGNSYAYSMPAIYANAGLVYNF